MSEAGNDQMQINEDDEDSNSSDDNSSYRDEGDSTDEEEQEAKSVQTRRELEWDDSTLNF